MPQDSLFHRNIVHKSTLVWGQLTALMLTRHRRSPFRGEKVQRNGKRHHSALFLGSISVEQQVTLLGLVGQQVWKTLKADPISLNMRDTKYKDGGSQQARAQSVEPSESIRNLGLASGCSWAKELRVAELNRLLFNFWQQLVKLSLLLKTQPLILMV